MADKFALISNFLGYQTKADQTNLDPRWLISGSQNVLINDGDKVETRKGYVLLGASSTSTNEIISEFVWRDSDGTEHFLRSNSTILQLYVGTVEGTVFNSWETLEEGFTSEAKMYFDSWWSSTESEDILLFVDGETDNLYEYSGGRALFSSATATTITKAGSNTWAQQRFLTAGTRQVRIKDTGGTWRTFTYTGGESTTAITGVTPDPTAFTFDANALILQEVRANDNQPASGFINDFIKVVNNQVYIGSAVERTVRVSSNTSITSYTFSSPRTQGEGGTLTLDGEIRGIGVLDDKAVIFAGDDGIFKTEFVLIDSSGLKETIGVKKLKTGRRQGAVSQDFIVNMGNEIGWLANDDKFYIMDRVENTENPFMQDVSDPIKPDFDDETFTNGCARFLGNRLFITAPTNGKVYILETRKDAQGALRRFWQPPQILPARMMSVYAGDVYFHSSVVTETYELFDGTDDNDGPIESKAVFAYRNFGDRANLKEFDLYHSELYMRTNTITTVKLDFDFNGSTSSVEYEINGGDTAILFDQSGGSPLGVSPLGTEPIGGSVDALSEMPKYIHEYEVRPVAFFELKVTYSAYGVDQAFQILSHGPNARLSSLKPTFIRKS